MSESLKTRVKKDPKAFVESLSPGNLRMFVSQIISHHFVMNFFGYSSIQRNFQYLPIKKLKDLVKNEMTDTEIVTFIKDNFDLYYKDLLVLMSTLTTMEEVEFISNIPDAELKKLAIDSSSEIVSAVNITDDTILSMFANKILMEKYEAPTEMTWVGIR